VDLLRFILGRFVRGHLYTLHFRDWNT
jgi:hypothetical protein